MDAGSSFSQLPSPLVGKIALSATSKKLNGNSVRLTSSIHIPHAHP